MTGCCLSGYEEKRQAAYSGLVEGESCQRVVRCLLDVARTSALTPSLICSNRKTHGFQGKLLFGPLFDVDPESLIDQPVRVFWEGEKKFFQGTVIAFDANTWKHTVRRLDPPCRMAV